MIKPAQQSNKVGAVLVIGGGVAGIQASLDLADSGQKVYLLEKSPAIGGYMARLDKTFPTNDCSMCILSPKIVECGRHLNIDTLTWSELQDVSGEAGNFKVKVRRKARYVDLEKCTGCGDCAKVCPVSFPDEFDAELGNRKAVFRPYPQAFPNAFVIDKRGKAPCRIGCPAGININAYVALTAAGKFDEALDVILETVPLPAVLGRVCDHPCEIECHLGSSHEPVAICALKRFLADYRREKGTYKAAPKVEQNLAKVAIIGSGPAGLAAARELARKGYKPEIFESRDKAGGMLRWGIPDYRLPPDVLDADIQDVLDEGVKLHLNKKLGKDFTLAELKKQGFEAVVLAVGAQLGSKFPVEGYDLDGFVDCIDFLNQANINPKTKVGEKVTVIGGGNSAVDAARVALRLGAKEVTIVYRRTRAEMPAIEEEIHAVEKEGINIIYLTAPSRLIAEGDRVRAMECVRMKLGEPDESGRRRPVKVAGSEFIIETDMVISAIGQKVDLSGDDEDSKKLSVTKWGTIDADSENASTNLDGVFAAGDAATGPASVIKAIAQGRKAANAVDCYLRKVPFTPEPQVKPEDITDNPPAVEESDIKVPRCKPEEIPLEKRIVNFDEVEKTFTEEQAIAEANRCLRCAVCSECMACVTACKAEAICHDAEDEIEEIHVGSIVAVPGFEEYLSKLKYDYGYSRYPDVVSSVQFERILSASGPFAGHVQRPSDGVVPKKIAFLQCVGSRDMSCRNDYCSSVCCMYAIKEAVIAKEHLKGVDVTIFFMDMRAFGKDFDKYYERAKSEYGVKFVRARVSDVFKNNGDSRLTVQYSSESGCVENDDFDMVVLSVGLESSAELRELGKKLKIRVEPN
ncbi:MAG: FAD-dependent oxidoreductase, partial [Phycisphaerae bacterium]